MAYKSKYAGVEIDAILASAKKNSADIADLAQTVMQLSTADVTMTEAEYAAAVEAGTIDESKTYYVIGDADE